MTKKAAPPPSSKDKGVTLGLVAKLSSGRSPTTHESYGKSSPESEDSGEQLKRTTNEIRVSRSRNKGKNEKSDQGHPTEDGAHNYDPTRTRLNWLRDDRVCIGVGHVICLCRYAVGRLNGARLYGVRPSGNVHHAFTLHSEAG
jgi:hypothetical protein